MEGSGVKWCKVVSKWGRWVALFLGEYQHNLDAKGRLIVPAKFREDLGETCVITKGLDGCLFVYPMPAWQELFAKLQALPMTKRDARAFVRTFLAGAAEVDCDKQGRIGIPQSLQTYAGLDKSVMLIGVADRIEVWSEDRWQAYARQEEASFEQLAEVMDTFDLQL